VECSRDVGAAVGTAQPSLVPRVAYTHKASADQRQAQLRSERAGKCLGLVEATLSKPISMQWNGHNRIGGRKLMLHRDGDHLTEWRGDTLGFAILHAVDGAAKRTLVPPGYRHGIEADRGRFIVGVGA
jgi:hypothetical protein